MRPTSLLKFLLIALPLLEIAVFIWVGGIIGAGWTVLLVILTTIIGAVLIRDQGFRAMSEFTQNARTGRAEPSDVVDGSFIFIGGFLLIIPGFITDTLGLLCLIPGLRKLFVRWLILALAQKQQPNHPQHRVIEGQFRETHRDNES